MRFLIVGLNFAPELTGVGKYTGEMAAWFAARGHAVSVITTRPYYPDWQRARGLERFSWACETWRDCRIIRCPIYVPSRITGLRRLMHLASFALSSIPAGIFALLRRRPDMVVAIAPTLFAAPVVLAAARLTGAKAWLHFQDLEVDAASGLGIINSSWLIRRARAAEQSILRRFDLVSAISPKMLEALERKGVARERLMLFPNWVDTARIYPLLQPVKLRRELGISDQRCIALYSGSMGDKQGLEYVIGAAHILAPSGMASPLFILAGAGPARAALEREARKLPNVRFLPLQAEERFNELLNLADIHLLPQRRDAADLVMPSKLGPMLAVGKPVIATALAGSQIALTLGEAGIIVPPADSRALAKAISQLAGDARRRQAMGEAAANIARSTMRAELILPEVETHIRKLSRGQAMLVAGKRMIMEK
jgi:colanic acid biosynthesis glycosyl transferase WcaI